MVGQEHITKTLNNQIVAGRVGHAYLFSGGRGTIQLFNAVEPIFA